MTRASAIPILVALIGLDGGSPARAGRQPDQSGRAVPAEQADGFAAAHEHLQKGRVGEALEVYGELAKTGADAVRIALGRSRCYEQTGRWKEAAGVIEAALEINPKNADLHARLAELRYHRGRYEEAEKSAGAAIKLRADHPLARLVLADVYTETGRIKEADEGYRWFVRFYNRSQPTDAGTLLLVARGAVQYARWNSVSQIFSFAVNTLCPDALKDDELSWQAYHFSGSLLLEKYNRAQAIPEFDQALAINPHAAPVLVSLAEAALQKLELEVAEQYAGRAFEANASFVPALRIKAEVKIYGGDLPAAQSLLKKALEVNPHDQRTLARLAACYVLADGPPNETRLASLLANIDAVDQAGLKEPGRFERLVVELAKRNPRPGCFLADLGDVLENRRQYDLAERLYQTAIRVTPQLSQPKTALGMLYMRTGKAKEAGPLLDDAFKADPYHVRVSNMRKVLRLLDGYETIATDHFVIRVDSQQDRILGRYMAEYLEEIYPGLVKQFGYEPPQRTQFEVYHDAKGLSAHQWFSARMVGLPWVQTIGASTGMVVALASPTASDKPFNWARVLKHEFVHVITLQQTRFNIPHWFTEALAVTAEGFDRPEEWNRLLAERVPRGEVFTLENLNDGFIRPESPADWQFAYCQSRLYAQYLVEKYGEETIPRLLDAYRRNLPTKKAIQEVCGVGLDEFERGYRDYLGRLAAQLGGAGEGLQKTPVELERAYRANRDDPQAAAEFAYALFEANQRRTARKLALQALEKNPREPLAAVVMAELALLAADTSAAAKYLEAALDRAKPHPRVLSLLARIRLHSGEAKAAAELYELGRKHFPHDVELLKHLAIAYLNSGERGKLKAALAKLVRIDPDDGFIRKKLAELALEDGDYAAAVDYGRQALHVDVLDAQTHRLLGRAYLGLKQTEKAVREFETALEIDPDDARARKLLEELKR